MSILQSLENSEGILCTCVQDYVIVVPWVSRVYGICTLRAVICIPEGAARGNTYNCMKSTNPYTLETHGTGDLYHNTITNADSYDKR